MSSLERPRRCGKAAGQAGAEATVASTQLAAGALRARRKLSVKNRWIVKTQGTDSRPRLSFKQSSTNR